MSMFLVLYRLVFARPARAAISDRSPVGAPLAGFALGLALTAPAPAATFEQVRKVLNEDTYQSLPQYGVNAARFGPSGESSSNRLRTAAVRTLQSDADLLTGPVEPKLLQANGICFAGHWSGRPGSPYRGLLAPDVRADAIVRASVLLDGTRKGDRRTLGLAIKLWPPATDSTPTPTVNVFVMESIGGRVRPAILDVRLDNAPRLGKLPALRHLVTALRLRTDLEAADRAVSGGEARLDYRPVNQLTGGAPEDPYWLRLVPAPGTPRVDAEDFRDELRLERYPGGTLRFVAAAAPYAAAGKAAADWHEVADLTLTKSFLSRGCDLRLHFPHPALPRAGTAPSS